MKTNEDIGPQSRESFTVCRLYGGGTNIAINLAFYIFYRLRRITFKFGDFTNFKELFKLVSTDFP